MISIFSKLINISNSRVSSSAAKRRLLISLSVFFICLTIPLAFLVERVYQQFRQEMFYQYRDSAGQVLDQVNETIDELIADEENRPFVDYQFYKVAESPLLKQKGIEVSPLSRLDADDTIPGLIGYFQISPNGSFSTPILPAVEDSLLTNHSLNIEKTELNQRLLRRINIKSLLLNVNLLSEEVAKPQANQSTIKNESSITPPQKLSELSLDETYAKEERIQPRSRSRLESKVSRKENILTAPQDSTEIFLSQARESQQAQLTPSIENSGASYGAQESKELSSILSKTDVEGDNDVSLSRSDTLSSQSALSSMGSSKFSSTSPATEIKTNIDSIQSLSHKFTNIIGEISPLQMVRADSGHYFFYRHVWREKQRYIQGFIVTDHEFLENIVKPIFLRGHFDTGTKLIAGYAGVVTKEFQYIDHSYSRLFADKETAVEKATAVEKEKEVNPSRYRIQSVPDDSILIYRNVMTDPFDKLELLITTKEIPLGPGSSIINMLALSITLITLIGLYALYRLGLRQISLAEERLNFVSSVSHELKTPLTSVLMYSEMLRQDIVADESKKKAYYDFIYHESERLSRLISNILQLSKLGRNSNPLNPAYTPIATLLDLSKSKISTLIEKNEFQLKIEPLDESLRHEKLLVDIDGFAQIAINLVDNAIKFSSDSERKEIHIGFRTNPTIPSAVCFYVRDFGPGIQSSQIKKVFQLFYRVGNELTRTQPGTGIGLALVNELAQAMEGRVNLVNCQPGTEFQVYLKKNTKLRCI